ncbi:MULTISPECIES: Uma2 family endonuclease [unclassified Microcoleus]|uniref:Uma2 family endonuclease n=1 Tax=unclassified Microcoleus TaxID=2642155 RepID=UPI001D757F62|nr:MULTISPECIES: Uma2 family endonuclease [unclassified Microcoleus]MCC3414500.1 Uma2 family endonuclease [Microcoleus sp. PH2017_02_FOX_O_A]MCC3518690.1 Uma2 family endonuclease [Microcoleus sp. PH2017_18_LLB_O_A]MCC3573908.1 Uma2 family endonuclease [Microcoleus sp. PH2017_34_RAT_O_A]MCC3611332.1 Uma2 family endonuclease [Microcoleus sp. PH2017_40_RAT_O_B]
MSEQIILDPSQYPDTTQLVQEDDTPLDSFINEKQQRLLTEVLSGYELNGGIPFIVAANVGIFRTVRHPAIVPDIFLSLNVTVADSWDRRDVRSYLLWEFGKPPEIAIEIVSPTPGNELGSKFTDYALMGVMYYVVYDPLRELSDRPLQIFQLQGGRYVPKTDTWFPLVDLGLTLWPGVFESVNDTWLRWCDAEGNVIPNVEELAARLSQTQSQLTESQLQLTASQNQTKQALLQGIQLGLQLKFGSSGLEILDEISAIDDLNLLQTITSSLLTVEGLQDLRQIYLS